MQPSKMNTSRSEVKIVSGSTTVGIPPVRNLLKTMNNYNEDLEESVDGYMPYITTTPPFAPEDMISSPVSSSRGH